MKVLLCGVRGSTPAPGAEFAKVGGNTSCVAIPAPGGQWLVLDAGTLKPIVHRTYPLAEFREAYAELERGRARGKIVLTM
jgi:NADPH:quinone reductase-like Zn-dependent oxidoreductase